MGCVPSWATLYLTPAGWVCHCGERDPFQFLLGLGLWQWSLCAIFAFKLTFKLPAIVLLVIVALVAFGPLAFFVPRLVALRRRGISTMGLSARFTAATFMKSGQ